MNEQSIKWFPDSAAMLIELLKTHTWNSAVRQLKREIAEAKRKIA